MSISSIVKNDVFASMLLQHALCLVTKRAIRFCVELELNWDRVRFSTEIAYMKHC